MNQPNSIVIEAVSVKDLAVRLEDLKKTGQCPRGAFTAVHLAGAKVLVRPFAYTQVSPAEIANRIHQEAAELLSLAPENVEWDVESFASAPEKISGIFICSSAKTVDECLRLLKTFQLRPAALTARLLAMVESFRRMHPEENRRVVLLDFARINFVDVAVLNRGMCAFVRTIRFEGGHDLYREVVQTIRSALAKSAIKTIEGIYVSGKPAGAQDTHARLAIDFGVTVSEDDFSPPTAGTSPGLLAYPNLLKSRVFNPGEFMKITRLIHTLTAAAFVIAVVLLAKLIWTENAIRDIKSRYNASDLKRAESLAQQLKSF